STMTCRVVDTTMEAFTACAPSHTELGMLAHARQVDEDQQLSEQRADGWMSVVFGNRLARGGATGEYLVHLVSVEGIVGALRDPAYSVSTRAGDGVAAVAEQTQQGAAHTVRLLSLTSWSFRSTPDRGDFAGLMRGLDTGLLRLPVV